MDIYSKLTVEIPKELMAKLKGYAAFSNLKMRVFITRILLEKVKKIEKGEDTMIKIEKKEK